MKQRVDFRGKGSMDMFRGAGFRHVVPPDNVMRKNPEIADRCRAANARIGTKKDSRYLFVDPKLCPKTCESLKLWRTMPNGLPSRTSRYAHAGDALTYAVWRFFPRRVETSKVEVQTFKRFQGPNRMRGF